MRLKRDLESGQTARGASGPIRIAATDEARAEKSVAVLYFENLSGVKEDEYLRDGITEDIITELSKIKGLNIFSRPTVLAFRDKPVDAGAGRPAARRRLRARPAACAAPATGCASTPSSWTRAPIFRSGRSATTAR